MTQANTLIPQPLTRTELTERRERDRGPGLLTGVGLAATSEQSIFFLKSMIQRHGFTADPNFMLDSDTIGELTQGLPEDLWDFSSAISIAPRSSA